MHMSEAQSTLKSKKGRGKSGNNRVLLEVKTSRTGQETPEAALQFFASLTNLRHRFFFFWRRGIPLSCEIASFSQTIHFFVSVPAVYQTFIESQLVSQYPKASMVKTQDYLPALFKEGYCALGQMKLAHSYLYPLKTYREFKEVDPLSSLLAILSKAEAQDAVALQFLLYPIGNSWQKEGESKVSERYKDSSGIAHNNPYSKVIAEKIGFNGFRVAIRVGARAETRSRATHLLTQVANSFSSFNNPSGNSLVLKRPYLWQKRRLIQAMITRSRRFIPTYQILNVAELATLFHFPGDRLSTIHNISWHKTILSDAPENLPIAENLADEEKEQINFFAKTEYKNKPTVFGIKSADRRRHMYIIGKSGTGKSTLIANLAIDDMKKRRGFCIIDPHGDLSAHLLDYISSYRVNDVIYLNPAETDRSFAINPLEVTNENQRELVASGIVAIFKKLYGHSWGPRLEYMLRNTILTALAMPNPTLMMVPELLTDSQYRARVVGKLEDAALKSFWREYEGMTERLRAEAISSVLNKVGQFTSSKKIRNIIDHPKSTVDFERVMNEGKILILNLSQGYLGEDNAALLGAMIITKIQLAAMNRVSMPEDARRDFYLYVDEFQNFATSSFIKILSEARKFHLNLILANQYIGQIEESVRAAIFGNAGTMMAFLIGAEDARYMAREFGERFKEEDLLALGNFQAIIKLAVDGMTQAPFLCNTLPLPNSRTQNREKVLRQSRERYTKPVK